ncbi:MAG TPA: hypothetical protein VGP12_08090 [Nitrosospira sp.]|nr:hypothetical protein [Nitrosospira sp.]
MSNLEAWSSCIREAAVRDAAPAFCPSELAVSGAALNAIFNMTLAPSTHRTR